jgi:hypothetical protein
MLGRSGRHTGSPDADEGIVLTCNGYTKDASKYAKSKNIKLVVLRDVQDSDWEGYIKTVIVDLHVQSNRNHNATLNMNQGSSEVFAAELKRVGSDGKIHSFQPVFLVRGDERKQFTEFLSDEVNSRPATKNTTGRWEIITPADGRNLQVEKGPLISFDSITTMFDVDTLTIPITVTSNRVAELIVKGLGDDDIFIFGDQLERRKIDPETGEIL